MSKHIPLLSGKDVSEFTPEEYKEHINSLYYRKVKKVSQFKPKKKELIFRLTKTGKLSMKVNREPKWISVEELRVISLTTGFPFESIMFMFPDVEVREHGNV
jgi:hypothetical protein